MSDPVAHGPKGGIRSFADYRRGLVHHSKVEKALPEISDPLGRKTEDFVSLPSWFFRTGLTSFEIETGLGRVKCGLPRKSSMKDIIEAQEKATRESNKHKNAKTDEEVKAAKDAMESIEAEAYRANVRLGILCLHSFPSEWMIEGVEGEAFKIGADEFKVGSTLPPPSLFHKRPFEDVEEFFGLLPPGLAGKVIAGYQLMNADPIDYEERNAVPGASPLT